MTTSIGIEDLTGKGHPGRLLMTAPAAAPTINRMAQELGGESPNA